MLIILPDETEKTIVGSGRSIEQILTELKISALDVLISHEGEIIPEDTVPDETDILKIIRVVHGG